MNQPIRVLGRRPQPRKYSPVMSLSNDPQVRLSRPMHVWIVQTGESLPCDGAAERPMRATALTRALELSGHRVTVISSDFWHQKKKHRVGRFARICTGPLTEIVLLPSIGYSRHVGAKRLLDHRQLGAQFRKYAPLLERPDVMLVGFPPIEIAFEAVSLASRWGIPSILDVKDQLLDIFWQRLPGVLKQAARFAMRGMEHQAKLTFQHANSLTSMSLPFLEWAADRAGRPLKPLDRAFPFGCDSPITCAATPNADERSIVFAGSITRSFDFLTLIDGFRRSRFAASGGKLVICGTGDSEDSLKGFTKGDNRILFRGWQSSPELAVSLNSALLGAAPYVDRDDFKMSLPNKIVEYTSFGLPILAPSTGEIAQFVRRLGVGYLYEPGSPAQCAAGIDTAAARTPEQVEADWQRQTLLPREP